MLKLEIFFKRQCITWKDQTPKCNKRANPLAYRMEQDCREFCRAVAVTRVQAN